MGKDKCYSVNLTLIGRRCVVIGGGGVAERKVRRLLDCGADVTLIAPEVTPGLKRLAGKRKVLLKEKRIKLSDLKKTYLVISATGDRATNLSVSRYCKKENILVNVVDSPKECTFFLPAIVTRGDLIISVSTSGISPALSKKIRQDLEKRFGSEYAGFLRIMKKVRPALIREKRSLKERRIFFKKIVSSDILSLLKKHKKKEARQKLERMLRN